MADIDVVLCPLSMQTLFDNGRPLSGAKIYVYEAGTTTPITVYQDPFKQAAHPRPFTTNAQGLIPPIYIGNHIYRIRVLKPNNTPLFDVDNLIGKISSEGGGGTPQPPNDSNILTGDIIHSYMVGRRSGWAECNGDTLGQTTSGATNIAAGVPYVDGTEQPPDTTFFLFRHLWEMDAYLPVMSAGVEVSRGATAISDWNANRQIVVPNVAGRTIVGIENANGGNSQITAQVTTTAGNSVITVSDASRLCRGMYIAIPGIPDGARITKIEGNDITLSAIPTSTLTQKNARFSVFPDAQRLGSSGGEATHILAEDELASHIHEATSVIEEADGAHPHNGSTNASGDHSHDYSIVVYDGAGIFPGGGSIGPRVEARITGPGGNHAHAVTIPPSGSHKHAIKTEMEKTGKSQPLNIIQPSIILNSYMKL